MGWLNIYAAVFNEEHQSIFDLSQRYGKQMLWIIIAIGIAIVLFIIDRKAYPAFSFIVYGITIVMLISVLIFGKEVHGARSWFEIGNFRLQPTEFAKLATNLALAKFLSSHNFNIYKPRNLVIIGMIIILPVILIILQNDTGSSLVYIAFILVLYREGLPGIVLVLGIAIVLLFILALFVELLAIVLILQLLALLVYYILSKDIKNTSKGLLFFIGISGIFWIINELYFNIQIHYIIVFAVITSSLFYLLVAYKDRLKYVYLIISLLIFSLSFSYSVDYLYFNVLEKHQRRRINVLFGINDDIKGPGYNVHQSKIAIGSGGLYGKGYLQGTQTRYDFVPEQTTDFIFCTIGEEWGFVGTTAVVLLFIFLLIRVIYLSEQQKSKFTQIYGYGLVSILFFHFVVNIGMTIGLAPVIGIPLPFFSYGGSSLWSFTILLFIFIRLDATKGELL